MKIPPNMLALVVALIVGVFAGYSFRSTGVSPKSAPQEKKEQKVMAEKGSKDWKIENAMSAAPKTVSEEATVLDWPAKEGAELVNLRKGTNDWTCLPDYPASPGNDPICVDKAAMQWFQAYMTKQEPSLTQPGIGYMLQGGSDPSNTDPFAMEPAKGEHWMNAPAHMMIFPAGKLDSAVYGTDHTSGRPWIMWADTPYEHLMIPVE